MCTESHAEAGESKGTMRTGKRICLRNIILSAMMLMIPAIFLPCETAEAAAAGSITVRPKSIEAGTPILYGTEFTLYQVGVSHSSSGMGNYVYTDDFQDCTASLENVREPELAQTLSDYVEEKNIAGGVTEQADVNGRVIFAGLDGGLYLLKQNKAIKGYHPAKPFLISLPMYDNTHHLTYTIEANPKIEPVRLLLEPVSISSYVGGDSMSGNHAPSIRYLAKMSDGSLIPQGLVMQMKDVNGVDVQVDAERIINLPTSPTYYLIPKLEEGLDLTPGSSELVGTFITLTHTVNGNTSADIYEVNIHIPENRPLTAKDADWVYPVEIIMPGPGEKPVTVTSRYVTDTEAMYEDASYYMRDVIHDAADADTSDGKAVAVIPEGETYYTNGISKDLGLAGYAANLGYQIALLIDDIVTVYAKDRDDATSDDFIDLMIEHAEEEASKNPDYSFKRWDDYIFKYIDLVNINDGNAWVSVDRDVTVYMPFPDAVAKEPFSYEYQVLHYKNMDREYFTYETWDETQREIVHASTLEWLKASATKQGIQFTVPMDLEGGMSPFAIMWRIKKPTTPPKKSSDSGKPKSSSPSKQPEKKVTSVQNIKLPQTGQLNYPIPLLGGIGILLFLAGRLRKWKGTKICMASGGILVIAAVCLILYNRLEDMRAGQEAESALAKLEQEIEEETGKPDKVSDAKSRQEDAADSETETASGSSYDYMGYLTIPALGLKLPVISDLSMSKLRSAPCRYTGDTEAGNLVIAGHNYSRHFGKLSHLQTGDLVELTDTEGKSVYYKVEKIETLGPYAYSEMVDSPYALTLFTCTFGGAERVTVRCSYPVEEESLAEIQ